MRAHSQERSRCLGVRGGFDYLDFGGRPVVRAGGHCAHALDRLHASAHPPKDGVLPIQPRRGRKCDEEL